MFGQNPKDFEPYQTFNLIVRDLKPEMSYNLGMGKSNFSHLFIYFHDLSKTHTQRIKLIVID